MELSCEFETVFLDTHGQIIHRKTRRARQIVVELSVGVVLELMLIPGDRFLMGSPPGTGYDDERPQHAVKVPSFLMSKYLITQEQWTTLLEATSWRFDASKRPVDSVSWHGALEFCRRLSERTGRVFRLPSEAQWEYACRAKSQTPFSFGPTITTEVVNFNGHFTYGYGTQGVYRHETTVVGSFPPNAFGLFDMHGNLWEWCADRWHDSYRGAPTDGSAWETSVAGDFRVLRGGSWHDTPDVCRSAVRLKFDPGEPDDIIGFRVVSSLEANDLVTT